MTAPELLDDLRARGVQVRVVGDRLRLAPPEALTPELLDRVRELKPGLLALLGTDPAPDAELAEVQRRLAADGPSWCVLTFAALDGAAVLVVREVPPPATIAAGAATLPRYTLPELVKLAAAGRVDAPPLLRALHELRRLGPAEGWEVASVAESALLPKDGDG